MKLLLLFGDMAVGKMTVGQELAKITELKLFHNHMTIEPVLEIFNEFRWDIIERLRNVFFEEFAATCNYGMIFTYMWDFDQKSDWNYIDEIIYIFKKYNSQIYFIELIAPKEIRMQRNITENRLKYKPSMRNIENSSNVLLSNTGRYNSREGEILFNNYYRIDNTNLSAEKTAKNIKNKFDL